jgi:hypothetical protein
MKNTARHNSMSNDKYRGFYLRPVPSKLLVSSGKLTLSEKMRAFWDIEPCSLVGVTDVSEVRTVSIISEVF